MSACGHTTGSMRIVDEDLLWTFRRLPQCERCKARNNNDIHPHHIIARGMGGGRRLDSRYNLVGLCARCHRLTHDGHIPRSELWRIVESREKLTAGSAEPACWQILNVS